MEILSMGTIRIGPECVVFSVSDLHYVFVWPEHRTVWDGESIHFTTLAGDPIEVRSGDQIEMTGGPLKEERMELIDWVNPPSPECEPTQGWRVYDIHI